MKKMFFLLVSILFSFSVYSQKVVIYADDGYAPYSYLDGNKAAGIYTEILEKAFSRMDGYEVEIQALPWARGISMVEKGEGFAIFPPYYRPEQRPWMDYSVPILAEEIATLVRKELLPRKKWIDDYKTLKIGINRGFSIFTDEEKKIVTIEEEPNNRANLLKLGARRIDVYVNDKISMLWSLKQLKSSGEYRSNFSDVEIGTTIRQEFGYLGYTNQDNGKFGFKKDFMKN